MCWIESIFKVWALDGILYFFSVLIETQRNGKLFPTFSPFNPLFWWTLPCVIVSAAHIANEDQTDFIWFLFEIACGFVLSIHIISENFGSWLPPLVYMIIDKEAYRYLPILFSLLASIVIWNESCSGKMIFMSFAAGLSTLAWLIHSQNSLGSLIIAPLSTEFSLYALSLYTNTEPCWRDYGNTHWLWHLVLYSTGIRCVSAESWEKHVKRRKMSTETLSERTFGVWWIDSKYELPVVGRFLSAEQLQDGTISMRNIYADSFCFKCSLSGFLWCYLDGLYLPIKSKMRETENSLVTDSLYVSFIRIPMCIIKTLGLDESVLLEDVCIRPKWSRCLPPNIKRVLVATDTVHRRVIQAILLTYFVNFC